MSSNRDDVAYTVIVLSLVVRLDDASPQALVTSGSVRGDIISTRREQLVPLSMHVLCPAHVLYISESWGGRAELCNLCEVGRRVRPDIVRLSYAFVSHQQPAYHTSE